MEFKVLPKEEAEALRKALERNTEGVPLHLDPLTTGWRPGEDELSDEAVVDAIKSVPVHY